MRITPILRDKLAETASNNNTLLAAGVGRPGMRHNKTFETEAGFCYEQRRSWGERAGAAAAAAGRRRTALPSSRSRSNFCMPGAAHGLHSTKTCTEQVNSICWRCKRMQTTHILRCKLSKTASDLKLQTKTDPPSRSNNVWAAVERLQAIVVYEAVRRCRLGARGESCNGVLAR
jgi:hypothetical protein